MAKSGKKKIVVAVRPSKSKKRAPVEREKEVTRLGAALRGLGGLAGGALGGLVGYGGVGQSAGSGLGAAISRWLGSGDYSVSANSIVQRSMNASTSIPMMHRTGQTITVRHREFICSLSGSTNFNVQRAFALQPADSNTFPWLSEIASKFQEYRFKGLVFHYVPTSGSAVSSTNSALGSVMMQTSYRANDTLPASKVEMMNEYWACEGAPNESFCHPIECDPKENPFAIHYTRTKPIAGSDSLLMYDMGVTYMAVQGQQGTNTLGDVWVSYEVELSKPVIVSNVTGPLNSALLTYASPATGNWFGSTTVTATGSIAFATAVNTLALPKGLLGDYLITINISASTNFTAADLGAAPTLANCAFYPFLASNSSTTYVRTVVAGATATVNRAFYTTAVTISDPSTQASLIFPAGSWTGAAASIDVCVSSLD